MGNEVLRVEIGIIGGTGLERLLEGSRSIRIGTPFGPSPDITIGEVRGRQVAFLPRHGAKHELPPHRVNYRANLWSLKQLGVERILATNAVGAINEKMKPGDFAIPLDIVDFTKTRVQSYFDEPPITHIDVTEPYCPELRRIILEASSRENKTWSQAILACTEGPRYETPAEIAMMRLLGCHIVGMTGSPEVFLARELELCYASLCFISNMAAGIQRKLTAKEVERLAEEIQPKVLRTVERAIAAIPRERGCGCSHALKDAQL
jgi:5'-methylthioadenosine phosphorylase